MVPPTQHVCRYVAGETKTNCQLILNARVLFERLNKFCYREMMLTDPHLGHTEGFSYVHKWEVLECLPQGYFLKEYIRSSPNSESSLFALAKPYYKWHLTRKQVCYSQ